MKRHFQDWAFSEWLYFTQVGVDADSLTPGCRELAYQAWKEAKLRYGGRDETPINDDYVNYHDFD